MNDDPWAPAAPIPGGSPWPPLVPAYMPEPEAAADDEPEAEAEVDPDAASTEPAPETQSPLGLSGAGSPEDPWLPGAEPGPALTETPGTAAPGYPPSPPGASPGSPDDPWVRGPEPFRGAPWQLAVPEPSAAVVDPGLSSDPAGEGEAGVGSSSDPAGEADPEPSERRPAIGPEPEVAAELASIFDGSGWPTVSSEPEPDPEPVADPEPAEPQSEEAGSEVEGTEPKAAWPDPDPASLVFESAGPDDPEPVEPEAASLVAEPRSVADVEAEPELSPAVSEAASPDLGPEPVEPEAAWLAEMRSVANANSDADADAEPEPASSGSEAASSGSESEPVEPDDAWLAAMRSNADDELEAAWLAELSRVVDVEPDPDADVEPEPESVPAAEAEPESVPAAGPEPDPAPVGEPVADGELSPADPVPAAADPAQTLWHGRFAGGPAEELLAFTVSLPFDQRLAQDDLAGSGAHVAGLAHAGLLTDDEASAVFAALDQVEQELAKGAFTFAPSDEDIHTAIERRVTELAGDAGAKLHTGRSRNDQVATALRLWCKRELPAVAERVVGLQRVLLNRAKEAGDTYLPGYTHLQRAQPVLLAHHLLAHGWALARDVDRIADCVRRLDVSPLGAGALAGSSLPLDPEFTAEQLGFAKTFDNSLDAVGDRDFVAEALFALSLLAVHLSRMGEEVVLWTTDEFGFARLADAYATGSSMLPQKKNADIAELARGKAGRAIGNLTGLLATLKGLPLAYNRDLQEDKEPLFDSVDQVSLALGAMAGLYRTLTFDARPMQEAADSPYMAATDLAEWLVQQGTPFRSAHAIVGELVRRALERDTPLVDLVALHPDLGPEPAALIGPGVAVSRRTTRGGGGPEAVKAQLERFEQHLRPDSPD